MLGAIAGDIIGSVHEFASNTRDDFPLFTDRSSPTDDSLLTCAVAEACLAGSTDYRSHILDGFRRAEHGPRTAPLGPAWGTGFRQWADEGGSAIRESYGNGAAMRVSAIGWAMRSRAQVLRHARLSALPSHAHPEGVRGARCAALAVFVARTTRDPSRVRAVAEEFYGPLPGLDELRSSHGYDESCQACVPAAMAMAVGTASFEACVRLACSIRGDADTLAAISGAVSEALWGVPPEIEAEALSRLGRHYPWAAEAARRARAEWVLA